MVSTNIYRSQHSEGVEKTTEQGALVIIRFLTGQSGLYPARDMGKARTQAALPSLCVSVQSITLPSSQTYDSTSASPRPLQPRPNCSRYSPPTLPFRKLDSADVQSLVAVMDPPFGRNSIT